jgi:hypothetical protein
MTEAALSELGINRRTIIQSQNSNSAARSNLVGDEESPEDVTDYCRNGDNMQRSSVNDERELVQRVYSGTETIGDHAGLDAHRR